MSLAPGTPWTRTLLGDPEVEALFGETAQGAWLKRVEIAFLEAQAALGVLEDAAASAAIASVEAAILDAEGLVQGTARDGVVVPELVRMLGAGEAAGHVHAGLTSQDVIDAVAVLTAREVDRVLAARLTGLLAQIDGLEARFGTRRIAGRTRMQVAGPIRVADRLRNWRGPLARAQGRLAAAGAELRIFGGGGADGTGLRVAQAEAVSAEMARRLGLDPGPPRHAQRDGWATYGTCLAGIAGAAGKIGLDLTLMAQPEIAEAVLSEGGRSSAMPHKVNPVAAETVVALARHAAMLSAGMGQALLHEQERSGSAWMLEWMAVPQLQIAAGAALRHVARALGDVQSLGAD
ncbi:MAG: lyase family protein [Pseudomonadota bacterium]